ncbi:ectonucleotide pyrophosphatase/phosphodiesterase family member 1 [Salmo salar]|uniref:Ectonucleotide pyrophosphatase/phosphodiesterase family member 1 n=2 Tax=Salmo salar TaxID=8030 RepID=A0A1S3S730_SALSA|nr:ectonucleotide pyrophosphatase/phosphodiesterase family member 1 [Salmo salar]XP_014060143.1 ectonucleotide pyrophosphatase/phosphodiesterase family member 1 [Salmo salar]|eukprot:XP_014060142.1 PREDICTED: ectonucleotide pyrophosphatase/phosphodiesterase family member 1 [Salmo salar]
MEISKEDEHSTEHAANLLGSPGRDKQVRHSGQVHKKRSNNRMVVVVVVLLCLLITVITVIFALKQHCNVKVTSCKNRCVTGSSDKSASCHCDLSCEKEGNCCLDYTEVCIDPGQRWTCSRFRCGEQRLADSLCSCSDDCVKAGDCCANYYSTCKVGVKSWIEEECEDIQTPQCPDSFSKPPLILVSMDGFRAGYLKAYGSLLPVINKLRNCGTTTPYMRPAYPTKTFPNHYTIVTGLYPESHGIVDNKMYDVTRNASFSLKVAEKFNAKWYQGEPVWLTAMYNKLKSATFFWPGADVAINGRFPDFYKMYDRNIPFEERISTIFQWLNLPQGERPDFYTLYLEEPDSAGHRYGPMSSQVIEALLNVDRLLGFLMDGLKQKNLHHCVNLVLLSDHGMEEASCKKAAFVNSYQDNVDGFTVVQGPAARIRPKRVPEDFYSFDYEGLVKNLSCRIPDQPMRPYLKEHLPKRMHFANNVRIERAHLYMKPGWQAALQPKEIKYCSGGFHGSDNVFKNMQTIFIGYGPGLKYKTNVAPFENIEVYNLLCDLLDIPPAPNNGTHGSLNHLLKNPPHLPVYPDELSSDSTCEASGPAPSDNLGCSCSARTKAEEKTMNRQLITANSNSGAKALHLPYGIPRVLQENADYCVLHHANYVNGYSKDIIMPLWVAYTINPLNNVQPLSPVAEACVRTDVRVAPLSSQNCVRYRDNPALTYGLLHPPNLGANGTEAESFLTSNMVPMYPAFKDVWMYFHDVLLVKYSQQLNGVNVVSGPIFDQHYDGHFDAPTVSTLHEAPFPTHFYVILTSCGNSSFSPADCQGRLETTSFILPHRPDHTETCANGSDLQWVQEWAQFHAARVRDVELLTGLSFYHDRISVEETLQLKTFLQTF